MRFLSIIAAALLTTGAVHAASDNLPNGKPFKILSSQIEVVQTQVDQLRDDYNALRAELNLLISRVDTIEQRQERIIQAIQRLQEKEAELQAQLDEINTSMAAMQGQIDANTAAIAELRAQIAELELMKDEIIALQAEDAILHTLIATNTGNIEHLNNQLLSNRARIEALELEIAKIPDIENEIFSLQNAIFDLQGRMEMIPDLERLINENRSAIQDLEVELVHLEDQVAFKQNVVTGVCPAGEAMYAIHSDGSVSCMPVDNGPGNLDIMYTYNYGEVDDTVGPIIHPTLKVTATCPAGYLAVGGTYMTSSEYYGSWIDQHFMSKVTETAIENGNQWSVTARRIGDQHYLTFIGATATCLKLSQY